MSLCEPLLSLCVPMLEHMWGLCGAYVEPMWGLCGPMWSLCGAYVVPMWCLCGTYAAYVLLCGADIGSDVGPCKCTSAQCRPMSFWVEPT